MSSTKSLPPKRDTQTVAAPAGRDDLEAIIHQAVQDAVRDVSGPREYFDTRGAAEYLGVSYQYLTIARHKRQGPAYIKLAGAVRYRRADLDAYMAARRRDPDAA